MNQYVAMKATALSSYRIQVREETAQFGSNLLDLVDQVSDATGCIIVAWKYKDDGKMHGRKEILEWVTQSMPVCIYTLVDGDQLMLLSNSFQIDKG